METNRLRQFCLIVETGSLSRAAEMIHLTHSALSKSMHNLQEELKTVLLQPSGRGISVTHEGLRVYKNAKQFLEAENQLFFTKKSDKNLEYKIGTVEIFISSLSRGLGQHPLDIGTIKLLDVEPGMMEQQIVTGNLDVGITYLPFPTNELKMIPVGKFKLGCFHREDRFQKIDISEIPFAVPAKLLPENPLGIKERDGWYDSLIPRKIGFRVNLLATAIQLCTEGHCAVYMPQFVAKAINTSIGTGLPGLVERPVPALGARNVQTAYVMCHERSVEDTPLRRICTIMRQSLR